ncbi:organic cation transporter protein-like [Porites lutea]|uniref:organic cation transporter protein-like n=1 Tax=Porites lutea TaxID=51062 RepID=UPI003CC5AE5A
MTDSSSSFEDDITEGNQVDGALVSVNSPSALQFDDILHSIGEFGPRQRVIYILCCAVVIIPSGIQFAGGFFLTGTPEFHCITPDVKCDLNKCCTNCTKYQFTTFTSAVTEYNLICDRAFIAASIQAAFSAGCLVGSFLFGAISDFYGRRFCMLLCSVLTAAFSVGASFSHNIILFAILRFATAASLTGFFVVQYVYILELVGPSFRTMSGKGSGFFWAIGSGASALLAYNIRYWRTLLLVASFPPLLFVVFYTALPESARWLVVQNRLDEAHRILMKFAEKNSAPVTSDFLRNALERCRQGVAESRTGKTSHSPLDLLRTSRMRRRSVILCFCWCVASLVFYGFLLYISDIEGDPYLNLVIMFVVSDVPGTILSWIVIQKFGRRIPFCLFMITGGLACLLVLIVPKDMTHISRVLAFIGRAFVTMSFGILYLFSSELYPTSIRNIAVGVCSLSARIGSMIAPYIVMLSQLPELSVTLPMVIFGILSLCAGLMILRLPETLNSNMCQTIEEANIAKEYYGFMWMGKRVGNPFPCLRVFCMKLTHFRSHTTSEEPRLLQELGDNVLRFSTGELTRTAHVPVPNGEPSSDVESDRGEYAIENAPLIS